jgi:MazG-like nucleotide pyrophosphohydrolase family protein
MSERLQSTRFIVLPNDVPVRGPVPLAVYQRAAHRTDELDSNDLGTPILGLFGEVGSLLAALKKKRREGAAFARYDAQVVEELGDVLWYFSAIASHAHLDLGLLAQQASLGRHDGGPADHSELPTFSLLQPKEPLSCASTIIDAMTDLAARTGEFVEAFRSGRLTSDPSASAAGLVAILRAIATTANAARIDLNIAARANLEKAFSRWPLQQTYPPLADADGLPDEQLPRQFNVFIEEQEVGGKTYVLQKRNGVIIGDRLTDNKTEKDDYRFHDVFHIAYAVHLGWSPVLRALFHVKRKSRPDLDENEDGARAILIEEGIATFVFRRALERDLFEGLTRLDYGLLKLVQDLVQGFEPERCALWQWEQAILDGFKMFRELKRHRRGLLKADLLKHTLTFEPILSVQLGTRVQRHSELRRAIPSAAVGEADVVTQTRTIQSSARRRR